MHKKNPNITCLFTEDDWIVWENINSKKRYCLRPRVMVLPTYKCCKCDYIGIANGMLHHLRSHDIEVPLVNLEIVAYRFRTSDGKIREHRDYHIYRRQHFCLSS